MFLWYWCNPDKTAKYGIRKKQYMNMLKNFGSSARHDNQDFKRISKTCWILAAFFNSWLVESNITTPVNSPHKGQWRGALIFSLICARTYGWVNNGEAGDLRRHRAHYDVIVMMSSIYSNRSQFAALCCGLVSVSLSDTILIQNVLRGNIGGAKPCSALYMTIVDM